jgi:hypothetical protein
MTETKFCYVDIYMAYLVLLTSVLMQSISRMVYAWIYWEHYVISPLHEGEHGRVGIVGEVYLCLRLPKIQACDKVLLYSWASSEAREV